MLRLLLSLWWPDRGKYPQRAPVSGWFGLALRAKASVCLLLGLEGDPWENMEWCAPVLIGPMNAYQSWDGPSADCWEIGVDVRWRRWRFYEYMNGI